MQRMLYHTFRSSVNRRQIWWGGDFHGWLVGTARQHSGLTYAFLARLWSAPGHHQKKADHLPPILFFVASIPHVQTQGEPAPTTLGRKARYALLGETVVFLFPIHRARLTFRFHLHSTAHQITDINTTTNGVHCHNQSALFTH